jgi:hypothetical protein
MAPVIMPVKKEKILGMDSFQIAPLNPATLAGKGRKSGTTIPAAGDLRQYGLWSLGELRGPFHLAAIPVRR